MLCYQTQGLRPACGGEKKNALPSVARSLPRHTQLSAPILVL
ncbi:hypothetical protein LINPERHAP2_LOCUS40365, partial [Linum perenne]